MKEAHAKFVEAYRRTGDPVKSALAAGSLERLAASDGARWLERRDVKDALSRPEEKTPARRRATMGRGVSRVTRKK